MTELVEWTNNKGKKVRRYPVLYGKARKQEKREEGEERQQEYDKKYPTREKKLAVASGKKHQARLKKQLKKTK